MGEAKRKRDQGIPVAQFKTPDGCVAVNIDGYLHFIKGVPPVEPPEKTAATVKRIMLGTHGFMALQDLGHTIACELVNSIAVLKKCDPEDEAKRARMNGECMMFAIALMQIERHRFVHIEHDSMAETTSIGPMRQIKSDAEFQKWHRDLVADRYGAEAEAGSQMVVL